MDEYDFSNHAMAGPQLLDPQHPQDNICKGLCATIFLVYEEDLQFCSRA